MVGAKGFEPCIRKKPFLPHAPAKHPKRIEDSQQQATGNLNARNLYFYIRSLGPAASCRKYARYPFKQVIILDIAHSSHILHLSTVGKHFSKDFFGDVKPGLRYVKHRVQPGYLIDLHYLGVGVDY